MQHLWLLVMGPFLVTFAASDVAVTINAGSVRVALDNDELQMLHLCLCNATHTSCTFDALTQTVTHNDTENSQIHSNTTYLHGYTCSPYPGSIRCLRMIQNNEQETAIKQQGKSFSLRGTDACDINCVDVVWNDTFTNVTINTATISGEVCAAGPSSSTQDVWDTKLITIITAVSSVLVVLIVSVIITVCVRGKRQSRIQKTARYVVNSDTSKDPELETINGLYAVSSQSSWHPDLDIEQEPMYFEVEKEKPNSREIPENSQLESNNLYSQLHSKTENVVNTYDILPHSGSHF